MKYRPKYSEKDHVFINLTLSVVAGIDQDDDDLPDHLSEEIKGVLKGIGLVIISSSIVPQKRVRLPKDLKQAITAINPTKGKERKWKTHYTESPTRYK